MAKEKQENELETTIETDGSIDLAVEQKPTNSPKRGKGKTRSLAVLPLPLFQPTDPVQLNRLFGLVRKLPELLHYFLRNHIFPKTMNFQKLLINHIVFGSTLVKNIYTYIQIFQL